MNPAILLQLLSYLIQYGPALVEFEKEIQDLIAKIVASLAANKELTPEQEAEFDQRIKDLESQPWWQPGQ